MTLHKRNVLHCRQSSERMVGSTNEWVNVDNASMHGELAISEPVRTADWRSGWSLFTKRQRSGDCAVDIALDRWKMTAEKRFLETIFRRLDGRRDRPLICAFTLPFGVVVALWWSVDRRRRLVTWHHITASQLCTKKPPMKISTMIDHWTMLMSKAVIFYHECI